MEMRFREMVFSQDWKKLNDRFFATIRVHRGERKYDADERVEVSSPKRKFLAHVLLACDWQLKDLPLGFLAYDLEAKSGETREDLINKLGKLYKFGQKPRETDTVTVYFLQKL
jgi:hypothetical protein